MILRHASAGLLLALGAAATASAQDEARAPWRANDALDTPEWLSVSGSFTTRYESLSNRLFRGQTGSNHGVFTRALLAITLRDTFTEATLEMIDSRILFEPDDARPTNGQSDAVDVLQGYFAARFSDAFEPGDSLRVLFGRHTMNVGSRRLVARNVYRNTINAFTGVNATWRSGDAFGRAFYTLPVERLPSNLDVDGLRDNAIEADEERSARRFFGVFGGVEDLALGSTLEGYAYGIHEEDAAELATRNRRLTTVGARYHRPPTRGDLHWELESAYQFGTSRRTAASTEDLDHEAYFHHVTLGYTIDAEHATRIEGLFDVASGDRSPDDGENNRFDSLYGVPRPEYGATGLFRPIARSNIVSPGIRITTALAPRTRVVLLYRPAYLASDRDAWNNGFVDPTGSSGSHIGDLTELVLRQPLLRDAVDLNLELGAAYWAAGRFARTAPGAQSPNDSVFGYVQLRWFF